MRYTPSNPSGPMMAALLNRDCPSRSQNPATMWSSCSAAMADQASIDGPPSAGSESENASARLSNTYPELAKLGHHDEPRATTDGVADEVETVGDVLLACPDGGLELQACDRDPGLVRTSLHSGCVDSLDIGHSRKFAGPR